MRIFSLLLLLLCFVAAGAQSTDSTITLAPSTEFYGSFNRTQVMDDNNGNGSGWGLGLVYVEPLTKRIDLLAGFEYNKTRQTTEAINLDGFFELRHITFRSHWVVLPVNLRLKPTTDPDLFIESGVFAGLTAKSEGRGITYERNPATGDYMVSEGDVGAMETDQLMFGLNFGLGIAVPMGNAQLIVKPEYRHGLLSLKERPTPIPHHYARINLGFRF